MRHFKAQTGYSIHKYITSKRLLLARSLLDGEDSVTAICYRCGFQDYTAFSRAFRRMFRMAPTEYRERHSGKELLCPQRKMMWSHSRLPNERSFPACPSPAHSREAAGEPEGNKCSILP